MKFLVDAQLPRRFANWLNEAGHDALHTLDLSQKNLTPDGEVIAVDGKTARGSQNRKHGKNPLHMVSAWATSNRLVLGQEATEEKSNEITAIPKLLKLLELHGCIVTIDAMRCQPPAMQG